MTQAKHDGSLYHTPPAIGRNVYNAIWRGFDCLTPLDPSYTMVLIVLRMQDGVCF